jgi:hypothetical protein
MSDTPISAARAFIITTPNALSEEEIDDFLQKWELLNTGKQPTEIELTEFGAALGFDIRPIRNSEEAHARERQAITELREALRSDYLTDFVKSRITRAIAILEDESVPDRDIS